MSLDIPGVDRGTREEAAVVVPDRFDAVGDFLGAAQDPDLVTRAYRDPIGAHRQSHGAVEVVEGERERTLERNP